MLAAGLVAQRGATLSHGAIVVREFKLPAVVNVPEATTRLQNGQEIRVNGTSGKIEVFERASLRTRITLQQKKTYFLVKGEGVLLEQLSGREAELGLRPVGHRVC